MLIVLAQSASGKIHIFVCVCQGVGELPDFIQFKLRSAVPLDTVFSAVGNDALELLGRTLSLNPLRRCTATQVDVIGCRGVREVWGRG